MIDDDNEDEPIDPRIGEKLEELNSWTERINKLEQQFEEENGAFRTILNEYSDKLKLIATKVGIKHVNEAREYYELKERSRQAQVECQKTVMMYEKSCQLLLQAKDEIERTESKFDVGKRDSLNNPGGSICQRHQDTPGHRHLDIPGQRDSGIAEPSSAQDLSSSVATDAIRSLEQFDTSRSLEHFDTFRSLEQFDTSRPPGHFDTSRPFDHSDSSKSPSGTKCQSPCPSSFDPAWQEVLNQAIIKLKEAESTKSKARIDHEVSMKRFMDIEEELSILEKKCKNSIKKSRQYFNESFKFKSDLMKKKAEIEFLNEQIIASKSYYSLTLKDLESISEEIHARRSIKLLKSLLTANQTSGAKNMNRRGGADRRDDGSRTGLKNEDEASGYDSNCSSSNENHESLEDSFDYQNIVPELKIQPTVPKRINVKPLPIVDTSSLLNQNTAKISQKLTNEKLFSEKLISEKLIVTKLSANESTAEKSISPESVPTPEDGATSQKDGATSPKGGGNTSKDGRPSSANQAIGLKRTSRTGRSSVPNVPSHNDSDTQGKISGISPSFSGNSPSGINSQRQTLSCLNVNELTSSQVRMNGREFYNVNIN